MLAPIRLVSKGRSGELSNTLRVLHMFNRPGQAGPGTVTFSGFSDKTLLLIHVLRRRELPDADAWL